MPRCNCGSRCNCVLEAGDGVTISGVGTSAQPYIIEAPDSGVLDLSAYEGESISLTATDIGSIEIVDEEGPKLNITALGHLNLTADGASRSVNMHANGDSGEVNISASGTGGAVVVIADVVAGVVVGDSSMAVTAAGVDLVGAVINVNAQELTVAATEMVFYGGTPVALQTGVAVTAEAIHAALVALGLITA